MKRRPKDVIFSGDHLWVRLEENNEVTIGVSDYQTGNWEEISKVTLPKKGQSLTQDAVMGEIEVDNTFISLTAPVSGKVIEVNPEAVKTPSLIIEDCYEDGWIVRLKLKDASELESLMDNKDYEAYVEEEDEELSEDEEEEDEEV